MERLGFIHEMLDIKILILYILRRLPGVVDPSTLNELCQCDGGVGYFEYSECLNELIETGHIREDEDGLGYAITEKGARNADTVESSLPFSVRQKALKLIAPVAEQLRRAAMIEAKVETGESGCFVELAMNDGVGEIIRLRLLCGDEKQAKTVKKNFRRHAEEYYNEIIELLSTERK